MNKTPLIFAGLCSVSLVAAGVASAAPPPGHAFNNWAAFDGRIILQPDPSDLAQITALGDFEDVSSTCLPPACVVLLNENGMMQARVRANNDPNDEGYFQTINIQEGFTGLPSALDFRNESFVETSNGGFPMTALNFVEFDDGDFMQVRLSSGALQAPGEAAMEIYQKSSLQGFGEIDFYFERMALGGAQYGTGVGGGSSLRIDYHQPNNLNGDRFTPFTVRQASGAYTQAGGTLEVIDIASPIAVSPGDHVATLFMAGRLWHLGPMHTPAGNADREFELHSVRNYTTDERAQWTSVNNTVDEGGIGVVNFQAAWADAYALNPNLWNEGLFGDAPNVADLGGTPFPGAPDHQDDLFDFGL